MSPGVRSQRVAGTILRHLSGELMREVHDPRLQALGIEKVEVTGDLGVAKVWVRLMVGGDDENTRRGALSALRAVGPGLRASLAPVLRMRRVPELRFAYDEGADHRARIDQVLHEIHEDERKTRSLLDAQTDDAPEADDEN